MAKNWISKLPPSIKLKSLRKKNDLKINSISLYSAIKKLPKIGFQGGRMAGSTPTWGCSSSFNHNPPKKQVWTVDPWHVQQVEPQTLIMEKIIMEKIIMEKPVNPWFHRKNQLWKKWNYGKKKVRITSGIFWTLMGKNLIMEKSDAGAACLS